MAWLHDNSIRRQLVWLSIFTSISALLLACAAFLLYDIVSFRRSMVQSLSTHAAIVASNSTAAVLFQDAKAAAETLSALRAAPRVISVAIRTRDGKLFASYARDARRTDEIPPLDGSDYRFSGNRLVLRHPIISEGATIGWVYVQSDLGELRARIVRYLSITALILLASLAAGVLMATRLQRRISGPILALVAAARSVSSDRNYAVRVNATSRDEIGLLGQTFNEMLEQIARQDAELRLAVRARDEFLSIASHELKTPLTPLQLQVQKLQLLLRKQAVAPGDRLASGLEIADRQVLRLSKLVENLLDISRITSKRMELEIEPVDLAAVAREVVARFQYEAVQAGCKVTLQAEGAVIGMWDRSRIDQVLTNFLSNAIKYGAGQPIELWVEHHDGLARFRIRDHGIGIAADDQARIFQRFERAVSSHSYGGFGLGLWIVKQIVDAFGGSIQVESAPRQGATFTMDLPRGSAPNMN